MLVHIPKAQLPEMQLQLPRKPDEGTEEEDRSKVCLNLLRCSSLSSILLVRYGLPGYALIKPLWAIHIGIPNILFCSGEPRLSVSSLQATHF